MSGYVRLHRKLLDNTLWKQFPAERLKVWLTILLRANYKPSTYKVNGEFKTCPVGTMLTSMEDLVAQSGCTLKQVRLALDVLKQMEMIRVERVNRIANRGTLISVVNWETYQQEGQREGSHRAVRGQSEGSEGALSEEGKKERISKHGAEAPDGSSPLDPSDTTERTPVSRKTVSEADTSFENEFWPLYPRKVGKAAALKRYRLKGKTAEARIEIMSGLKRQLPDLRSRDQKYVPHAATWLNEQRWEDSPEPIHEQEQPVFRLMM